jgi:hypothetical protein
MCHTWQAMPMEISAGQSTLVCFQSANVLV